MERRKFFGMLAGVLSCGTLAIVGKKETPPPAHVPEPIPEHLMVIHNGEGKLWGVMGYPLDPDAPRTARLRFQLNPPPVLNWHGNE
jgi:hypothetical protein